MSKRLDDALLAYSCDGNKQKLLEALAAITAGEPKIDFARFRGGEEAAEFERWVKEYRASTQQKKIGDLLRAGEPEIGQALTQLDEGYRYGICGQLREIHPDLAAQGLADIWQDVLLALYRKALQGTLDFEQGVDGMIWAIAELRAQDLVRTKIRRQTEAIEAAPKSPSSAELGRRWQMLTDMQKEEVKDLIWTSVDRLPAMQNAVWRGYLQYVNDHSRPPTTAHLRSLLSHAAAESGEHESIELVLRIGRYQTSESLVNNGYDIFSTFEGEAGEVDKQDVLSPIDRLVSEAFRERRAGKHHAVPDFRRAAALLGDDDRDALQNLPPDVVTRVRSKYGALRMWSSPLWSDGRDAETYLPTRTILETKSRVEHTMEQLDSSYQMVVNEKRLDWAPRCQFVALLGEGGQGVVYLVKRPGLDGFSNLLALKIFAPDRYASPGSYVADARRMARMAGIVADIHHPNVLDVVAFEEQSGVRMMLMEWVDGYDLGRLTVPAMLKRLQERASSQDWDRLSEVVVKEGPDQPRLRPFIAVAIIQSCLAALERMHERGIVHGDIKPSNIMLTRNGYVKLIDIGSAFVWSESPAPYHCTYRYAAPEVLEGDAYTPQSDLASLGYVLVELLSGRALFANLGRGPELLAAKASLPRRLDDLLPDRAKQEKKLVDLCRRLVEPDPAQRFASACDADLDVGCGTLALQNRMIKANFGISPEHEISHWLKTLG